ncbi:YncE family protein, partial [Staphylococcus aureus]
DKENRKVYIAHDTKIDVLDADSGESVGVVQPVIGAHGVAVAPEYNRGFASSGKTDSVKVFDLKTLAITSTIPAGKRPDAVAYDHITKRVLAFN